MSIISLDSVKYTYKSKYQTVNALNGISGEFEKGLVYAIVGSSGSGKSTLLSLMAAHDLPTEGNIYNDIFFRECTRNLKLQFRLQKGVLSIVFMLTLAVSFALSFLLFRNRQREVLIMRSAGGTGKLAFLHLCLKPVSSL